MARKPYNGFSPQQRARAGRWYSAQRAHHRRGPCDVCGATEGVYGHSEDYSEPFTLDNIGAWLLCYTCHMVVHSRYRAPESFRWYRDLIAKGHRFPPIVPPNYSRFAARFYPRDATELGDPVRAPLDPVPLLDELSLDPTWTHPNAPEPVHLP